MEGIKFLM